MTANQDFSASGTVDNTTVASSRNIRFALRKKRNFNERSKQGSSPVNLSSYNSDFLSGLFADVAKANVLRELSIDLPSSSTETSTAAKTTYPSSIFDVNSPSHIVPDATSSPRPTKKSRVSFRSSSFRTRASCMNLASQVHSNASKHSERMPPKITIETSTLENNITTTKVDSLAYQLDCLKQSKRSLPASVSPTKKSKKDIAALAFPNLPSTVSDSSCESNNVTSTGLTRERCLIPHGSAPEITASGNSSNKESFGWFVDLDDNEDSSVFSRSTNSRRDLVCQDLAFQAPTAPKPATDHVQEEMEKAYAADTIDSVLGDFF